MADSHVTPLTGHGVPGHHAVAVHGHGDSGHTHHPRQQHHFYSMAQQFEASILGMWIFLVTEVMFFAGLFMAYLVYRSMYPEAWVAGSNALNVPLGAMIVWSGPQ